MLKMRLIDKPLRLLDYIGKKHGDKVDVFAVCDEARNLIVSMPLYARHSSRMMRTRYFVQEKVDAPLVEYNGGENGTIASYDVMDNLSCDTFVYTTESSDNFITMCLWGLLYYSILFVVFCCIIQ